MSAALSHSYIPPPDDDPNPRLGAMSFLDHLDELRKRLVRACIAIAVGVLASFIFIQRLFDFVFAPVRRVLPPGTTLIYTQPGEAFALDINIALIGGVVLAAPFIAFQLWRFIAPALYTNEKKLAIPFVLMSSAGIVAGSMFNHYVMFPSMMAFFGTFSRPDLRFMPRVEDVFDLYSKMWFGMIVVFQMPTLTFFLARMRIITAGLLARNFKYAILGIFTVAAFITPSTDPWNQTVMAVPMIGLYLLGIAIAWFAAPRKPPAL
jgi:sec-independent protein translocase protein TatC